jgi:hypothetical protein
LNRAIEKASKPKEEIPIPQASQQIKILHTGGRVNYFLNAT